MLELGHVTVRVNPLTTTDFNWSRQILCSWYHFRQSPWDLGSAPAGRAWQGEVGGCTQRVQTALLLLGLAVGRPWLALDGTFLSSFVRIGLEDILLALWGLHFWLWRFFLGLHGQSLAESHTYWGNEWVWLETLICREWLQEQLGEVLSVNTQGNGEYGIFKGPIRLKWPLENLIE